MTNTKFELDEESIDNNPDVLSYYKDNEKTFISFKIKRGRKKKVFYDYRILTAMKINNYLIPNISKWFTDRNLKTDSLEMLMFFFDEKKNIA